MGCGGSTKSGESLVGAALVQHVKCSATEPVWALSLSAGRRFCEAAADELVGDELPELGGADQQVLRAASLPRWHDQDLLRPTLETCLGAFVEVEVTKLSVGLLVDELDKRAKTIINESTGKGPQGQCPFSSAYEVHMFYRFSLSHLGVWSGHQVGKDEDLDAAFYSQLNTICEILNSLDTSAVFLPEDIAENILLLRSLFWSTLTLSGPGLGTSKSAVRFSARGYDV